MFGASKVPRGAK